MMLNQTIPTTMVVSLISLKVINQDQRKSVFLESKITTRKICVRANLHSLDRVQILVSLIKITRQMQ
jgi:hypothetical protein